MLRRLPTTLQACSHTAPTVAARRYVLTPAKAMSPTFSVPEALHLLRVYSPNRFDETVEIAIKLNVDPRKPNQMVRGVAKLPNGIGKSVRIAVFAKGAKADEARAAGADIVGDADLAEQVLAGKIDFNKCIATPDMMGVVGKVARVLGPRGLMPNPKLGTVTNDLKSVIESSRQGQIEFKCEKAGIVNAGLGKLSFDNDVILANIDAFVKQVLDAKPSGAKGVFLKGASISSSVGRGITLNVGLPPFKNVAKKSKQ